MVSVLVSSVVDHEFKFWSGQTKDYKIGTCCFFTKHAEFRSKSKDGLAQNQDHTVGVEWNVSHPRPLFQWANTIKIQLSMLV